jgi:trans-aconitate methyltransferase
MQQKWAHDLISRLQLRGMERILDVGCGDGKISAELARAVPRGEACGVDASPQMIEFARKTFPAKSNPNLRFRVMDARRLAFERQFDLVFSNATLHWVDDHQAFLRGASNCLRPGGSLIISCGGKGNSQDVFVAVRSEIRRPRWRQFFRKMPRPYHFYSPMDYGKWLPRFGFRADRVELAPKEAVYNGIAGFSAWLRTTWLPYTQCVPEAQREEFIAAVAERYVVNSGLDLAGDVHVQMVRLEIEAHRE